MKLYHYIMGKQAGVYAIEPGTPIEQVFNETKSWVGTRLILVKG